MELYAARAADLGNHSKAHHNMADVYYNGGDLKKAKSWFQSGAFLPRGDIYDMGGDPKKAKFHYEATAMAGDENARYNLGGTVRKHGTSC